MQKGQQYRVRRIPKGIALKESRFIDRRAWPAAVILLFLHATEAMGGNGYMEVGYGVAARGMAGVSYSVASDSLVAATNPAVISMLDSRCDAGLNWIIPRRDATISGNNTVVRFISGTDANGYYDGNESKNFFIPEIGCTWRFNERWSFGAAIYGSGFNTDYGENPFAAFQVSGEPGRAGLDLAQVFITGTVSYKPTNWISLGVAPTFVVQRFKAFGLQAIAGDGYPSPEIPIVPPLSVAPDRVTDNGYGYSTGVGYRVGVAVEPVGGFVVAAAVQPRIHMSKISEYSGLLADGGMFDVPAVLGAGASYRWGDDVVVGADVQRIFYSDVPTFGNGIEPLVDGVKFGASGGPGLGLRDMTIYKIGAAYAVTRSFLLRGGFSYGRQPVPQDQTFINILAPGVSERHFSVGGEYRISNSASVNGYVLHSPKSSVRGKNSIPDEGLLPPKGFGGGEADIEFEETMIGLSLVLKI